MGQGCGERGSRLRCRWEPGTVLSVLTVNYHSSDQLRQLAESLSRHAGRQSIELVVTNNSPADAVRLPTRSFSITILESRNRGFAAGINRALRASRGETIMIANPDVKVTAGALDRAVDYLAGHPDVGVLLPLLRYPDGRIQFSVRRFYTWPVVLYARSPARVLGYRPPFFRRYLCEDIDRSKPVNVDWGLGAAMFLRRQDCGPQGVFDEGFFMYFEDVDLCYRTWQRGQRVLYCPQVECVHAHRRMSRNPFSLSGWRHTQSLFRFIRKHGGLRRRPAHRG